MNRESQEEKAILIKKRSIKIAAAALAAAVVTVLAAAVGRNLAQSREIHIGSLEELEKIGREEGYPLDGRYLLEGDIDGGGKTIAAIGSEDKPFAGHFDGQGHTISNLTVEVKKVREIRTKEVVKQEEDKDTAEQNNTAPKNADPENDGQKNTDPKGADQKEGPEANTKETAEKEIAEKEEPEEPEKASGAGQSESTRYIISVDGYPLFEYTSEVKPGQIENLCLDGLKTQQRQEPKSAKEPEEAGKQQAGTGTEKKETDTKQKEAAKENKGSNPIELHTWEDFKNIGNTKYNKAYTMDADYILVKAIKSDGKKFTPIGTKENPFTGTFDGQGKKIDVSKNKEIKTDSAYSGLFGTVKPAAKED